ncbi:helix-turn-helix transcriptional regulator [Clostridium cadaveris]|uniref:helix-turn-helix domain-containing protein n=1 Tax=Clostridium cadaveris TaxID=1529 RepID=UPI0031D4A53D
MNIGEKIKFYRKNLNLSQEELAKMSGLSRNAIYNYEKGKRQPDFTVLNDISAALNCSVFDLTMDTDKLKNDVNLIESEKYIIELAEKNNIKITKEYDDDGDGEYLRYVYIKFENKEFRLSSTEFHELSQRIIDSLITNIVAAENYNLIK